MHFYKKWSVLLGFNFYNMTRNKFRIFFCIKSNQSFCDILLTTSPPKDEINKDDIFHLCGIFFVFSNSPLHYKS